MLEVKTRHRAGCAHSGQPEIAAAASRGGAQSGRTEGIGSSFHAARHLRGRTHTGCWAVRGETASLARERVPFAAAPTPSARAAACAVPSPAVPDAAMAAAATVPKTPASQMHRRQPCISGSLGCRGGLYARREKWAGGRVATARLSGRANQGRPPGVPDRRSREPCGRALPAGDTLLIHPRSTIILLRSKYSHAAFKTRGRPASNTKAMHH